MATDADQCTQRLCIIIMFICPQHWQIVQHMHDSYFLQTLKTNRQKTNFQEKGDHLIRVEMRMQCQTSRTISCICKKFAVINLGIK